MSAPSRQVVVLGRFLSLYSTSSSTTRNLEMQYMECQFQRFLPYSGLPGVLKLHLRQRQPVLGDGQGVDAYSKSKLLRSVRYCLVGRRGPRRRRSRRSHELVQQRPQRPLRHARTWFRTAPFARADRSRTAFRTPSRPSLAVRARTVSLVVPIRSTHAVPIRKHARRPGPHRVAYKSRSAQYRTPSRFVGTLDVPIRSVRRPAPRCHIPLV